MDFHKILSHTADLWHTIVNSSDHPQYQQLCTQATKLFQVIFEQRDKCPTYKALSSADASPDSQTPPTPKEAT